MSTAEKNGNLFPRDVEEQLDLSTYPRKTEKI